VGALSVLRTARPASRQLLFLGLLPMEIFTLLLLLATGFYILQSKDQKRRIHLLGQVLGKYQIEKMMETLAQGYNRALNEPDASRQSQILALQRATELALSEQFSRFAAEFSRVDALDARVSTLSFAVPYASRLFPGNTFDLRQAFSIHAQGLARATDHGMSLSPKTRAFHVSAELFLMQHTCHWFCRSKSVASSRLLVRHKTSYAQLLGSVLPQTRQAYDALTATEPKV
jgi:acetyl esterase/lipase